MVKYHYAEREGFDTGVKMNIVKKKCDILLGVGVGAVISSLLTLTIMCAVAV